MTILNAIVYTITSAFLIASAPVLVKEAKALYETFTDDSLF